MTEKRDSKGEVTEVTVTRVLNAPRAMVFKAWTDPEQIAEWWGPHHFTNKVKKWEARAGGAIDLDMIGPDGNAFPMSGKFVEVREPERLVFTASALDQAGKALFENLNTITLVESGGRTILTVQARVVSQGPDAEQYLKGMEAGWTQSVERLDAHLVRIGEKSK